MVPHLPRRVFRQLSSTAKTTDGCYCCHSRWLARKILLLVQTVSVTFFCSGPDAISKDPGKGSPLHAAANYGHLDVVRLLVSRGANIEVQDTTRHTPLMYAAFEGHIDIVRYLLSVGADVNAACMSGETSLHEAAQGGKTKIVEVLLEHGHAIDPMDTRWSGATPLMWSARWGHTETFQTLLAAGADHKLTTTDGVSLTKWIGYEETVNNPLYNISGAKARLDIQRMLEEL